jgi:hypothetical protein
MINKVYVFAIFIFFSSSGIAYSYIDLSQLAVFFQIIFAGLLTALLTINLWFKQIIKRIKEFLLKFKKKSKP